MGLLLELTFFFNFCGKLLPKANYFVATNALAFMCFDYFGMEN